MSKFEQLLDYLVNEEMDKANELFHEIVVEKSRDIYENLIAEEEDEEVDEASDEEVDEAADEEEVDEAYDEEEVDEAYDEETDEGYDEEADEGMEELEDSYMMDGDDDEMPPQDDTDNLGADAGMDDMEMPSDPEEKVKMEIQAAIDKLEQAFATLGGDSDMGGMDDMGGDADMEKPAEDMMGFAEGRRMTREYVEKVGNDWDKNSQKQQGAIVGKNTGDSMPTAENTKPPISSGKGKPTTGATAHNILGGKGGQEGGHNTGTSPNKPSKGINPESGEKFTKGVTTNLDGSTTGVKKLSKVAGGHGAEKKGSGPGPVGSGTGDKAGQTSVGQVKSPINGAPGRNA
jgi:hypothetical protein